MVAAPLAEVSVAGAGTTGNMWFRPEDAALAGEDDERHAEQAARNAKMRDLLRLRRQQRDALDEQAAVAPEDFMSVKAAAQSAPVAAALDESQPPWFVMRPHLENAVLRLHEELIDFADFMKHTREEVLARRRWVKTIASACRTLWPNCQVKVFGSFFTGLSLPNGDVDIAVFDVPCKPPTAMKMLADHMLTLGEISWLEIIESAKVPVMKVRSQACGLRADVVFNQLDGLETSRFIRERLKEFPQMRPLLVFMKYFLLQRGLHETYTGGMGSYLLCNVVLHFIQRHPSRRNSHDYASTSLGHLLFDLFKYYGQEFRYDTQCISVLDGGNLYQKAERGWNNNGRRGNGLQLCLETPVGPPSDLGSACFRIGIIKNLFHHGFHCLCHLFAQRSPAEASMLCPLLLDPAHPVIRDRYALMAEQPVALPGLPRAADREAATSREDLTADDDDGVLEGPGEDGADADGASATSGQPPAKRRRKNAGKSAGGI